MATLFETRIEVDHAAVEVWSDLLAALGDEHWSVREDVIAQRAWVSGFFESEEHAVRGWAELQMMLPGELAATVLDEPVVQPVADADWRESYKAHFRAWRCGRLHWIPEWERETRRLPRGHVAVYLDPGMAFGTGNHETTRLCVKRLVRWAGALTPRRRRAARVIDAGCGSGILAISAVKLGLPRALAFDNDPEAVAIARQNARRNGVGASVRTLSGDVAAVLRRRRADVVLANILADVLVRHARVLIGAVRPGGLLVLSGILASECDHVRSVFAAAAPRGARITSSRLGEWADLCLRLPPTVR